MSYNFIRKIYYLTQEQYNTLITTGEVDIGDEDNSRIIQFNSLDTYLIKQPAASGGPGGGMGPQGPQGPKGEKGDPGVGIEEISISESGVTDEGIIYDLDITLTDGNGYSPSFMAPRGVGIASIDIDEDEVFEDGSIRYSITFTLTNDEIVIRYFTAPSGSGGDSAAVEAIPVETIGKITSHQTVEYDDQYLDVEGLEQVWKAAGDEFVAIGNSKVITDDRFIMRETAGLDNDITGPLAEIQSIKGNTIVWNQLVKNGNFVDTTNWYMQNGTLSVQNNICSFTIKDISVSWTRLTQTASYLIPNGHKALLMFDIKHNNSTNARLASAFQKSVIYDDRAPNVWHTEISIYTVSDQNKYLTISIAKENLDASVVVDVKNVLYIDLTLMFGEGNEPTSVDEFMSMFSNWSYEYNTGELKNININGIKTIGLNAFDGQLELGEIYTSGDLGASNVCGRVVNYIKTIPNADYTLYIANWVDFDAVYFQGYDGNFSSLGRFKGSSRTSDGLYHITTPDNCRYIKFSIRTNSSDKLIIPNDLQICFHLTHTGVKDGTYESFFTDYREINTSKYFSDGLKGINDVCDELSPYKSIKRIGSIDLGTLYWYVRTGDRDGYTYSYDLKDILTVAVYVKGNLLCKEYTTITYNELYQTTTLDKIIAVNIGGYIEIKDSALSGMTAAEVKQALSGVILYYELAEPVETIFDQPLYWTYGCEDFGTEEWISSDTPFLAPPSKIQYWSNFIDTLRRLSEVYIQRTELQPITLDQIEDIWNSNLS